MADFRITNHGSIFIVEALSHEAIEFSATAFASAQTWGINGYVVEHRYISSIIDDLVENQGFAIEGANA